MATTLAEHISVEKINDYCYISKHLPQRMGNSAPIAYGGYAIAVGIHSACKRAPDGFHLYSAFGYYLRAASTKESLVCKIKELRKTRNFITYRVIVEQKQINGKMQSCMELLTDFHRDEPSLLIYSATPTREYSHWQACVPWESTLNCWLESGKISQGQSKTFHTLFGLSGDLYEILPCPEGVASQNLMGLAKKVKTTQDESPPATKSSADWIRVKSPLQTEGEQTASLGFIMDGMLSFLPLTHNHLFFDDVAVCSSLDFALRIFSPDFMMNDWHLREVISHVGSQGRTYSESRLWDGEGNMVASMTQQSILRVPAKAAKI